MHPAILLLALLCLTPLTGLADSCTKPLSGEAIGRQFERLAKQQMALEFGQPVQALDQVQWQRIGADLYRVDAQTRITKPGASGDEALHLQGWLTACGSLVLRGYSWDADGSLSMPSYRPVQLPGPGLTLGPDSAPLKLLVFVDSRCPQCHRLLQYARPLWERGALQLELRQIAFLEPPEQSLNDSRLHEAAWLFPGGRSSVAEYLDLIGGFPADESVPPTTKHYPEALAYLRSQTELAHGLLHIRATPLVLIWDAGRGHYRESGYWEINRLLMRQQ